MTLTIQFKKRSAISSCALCVLSRESDGGCGDCADCACDFSSNLFIKKRKGVCDLLSFQFTSKY